VHKAATALMAWQVVAGHGPTVIVATPRKHVQSQLAMSCSPPSISATPPPKLWLPQRAVQQSVVKAPATDVAGNQRVVTSCGVDRRQSSPVRRESLAAAVARVGARLGMRPSHTSMVAELLEENGLSTVGALSDLSETEAAKIGVPRALAIALREDSQALREPWVKTGPVPPLRVLPPPARQSSPLQGRPTMELHAVKPAVHDDRGGFPSLLRSYSPLQPRGRTGASPPISPRACSPSSLADRPISPAEVHVERQQLGRGLRQAVKPLPQVRRRSSQERSSGSASPSRPCAAASLRGTTSPERSRLCVDVGTCTTDMSDVMGLDHADRGSASSTLSSSTRSSMRSSIETSDKHSAPDSVTQECSWSSALHEGKAERLEDHEALERRIMQIDGMLRMTTGLMKPSVGDEAVRFPADNDDNPAPVQAILPVPQAGAARLVWLGTPRKRLLESGPPPPACPRRSS